MNKRRDRRAPNRPDEQERADEVWKDAALANTFLAGVRGGIPLAAEQIDVMLRIVAARGEPVVHFADLGCGSGVLAAALLMRYPQAGGTLVDFSQPMLDAARAQLGDHVPPPRFVLADLALPQWVAAVADRAPYDVVVSGYAIHHLPDGRKRQLYAEIFDLLAPGGIFLNVEHVASPDARLEAIADELMIDSLYAFHTRQGAGKTRAQVADEYVHRPDKAANILAPVDVQCRWLRDCGFQSVDCFFKVFELAVFGGHRPHR
jgi:tRNA (cmo5U34)-methyltransferase